MLIQTAYDEFMKAKAVYCSSGTLKSYENHLQEFFKWLAGSKIVSFDDVSQDAVNDFIMYLRRRNSAIRNTTIRTYCRSLKVFLKYCLTKGYCPDLFRDVRLPRDDAPPKMPLTASEIAAVDSCFNMSTVIGTRNYSIIHLMLDSGLRCQEVLHLRVEHLQPEKNIIYIKDSKGRKSRFVLAPDYLFDAIRKYMFLNGHSRGYVFLGIRNDDPITQNTIRQMIDDVKRRAGVPQLHAHLLRHTFATSYLIGGGNLEFLRAFMGHYDYSVTQIYTQIAAQCKMLGIDVYQLDNIFFTKGY